MYLSKITYTNITSISKSPTNVLSYYIFKKSFVLYCIVLYCIAYICCVHKSDTFGIYLAFSLELGTVKYCQIK